MSDDEYTSGVLLESLNEFMVKTASREQLEQVILDLHKRYVKMKDKRYKPCGAGDCCFCDDKQQHEQLQTQLTIAVEALEWYANKINWSEYGNVNEGSVIKHIWGYEVAEYAITEIQKINRRREYKR